MSFIIRISTCDDFAHAQTIGSWYQISSLERGIGIATRTTSYLQLKMEQGDAIIALQDDSVIGFCYIETFENKEYVSNSGLIVHQGFRNQGIAKQIKKAAFDLARKRYPKASIFGITTSEKVMKINSNLGYQPTSFKNLTSDEAFWKGCSSCPNYDILLEKDKKICLCTAMIALPKINSLDQPKSNENE